MSVNDSPAWEALAAILNQVGVRETLVTPGRLLELRWCSGGHRSIRCRRWNATSSLWRGPMRPWTR